MDKELLEKFSEDLMQKLTPAIEGKVEASITEKMTAVEETQEEIQESIKEMNENIKLGAGEKTLKLAEVEAKEVMGKVFKFLAKRQVKQANDALAEFGKKATYQNEGVDAEGGYLVPIEYARQIFTVAGEYGLARKLSTIIPMATDKKDIPSMTNSVVAYWTDEGIAYTGSKPTYANISLIAYKATALVSSTIELIDDNQTDEEIWNITTKAIAEKIAEFEDTNIFVTSTKFTALLADATINEVVMGAGLTSFADITYDDLINLKRAVSLKYKKGKAAFFMSEDVFKYIELLKDTAGQPIFFQSRNWNDEQIATGSVGRLLGHPLYLTDVFPEDADDAVSTSFVLFGDMKYWAFGSRKTLSFDIGYLSGNWEKDIQSMKANERIAGVKLDANAFGKLTTAAV